MANSPPLVIANCLQVKLGYILATAGGYNVLHFVKAGSDVVTQATAEAVGAAAKTAWTANMAPHCGGNTALARVSVRDLSAPNLPEFVDTGALTAGVDNTADSLPPGLALCITIRTAKSGKSFRGRVYVGGFNENMSDLNGLVVGTAVTAALEYIGDFATAMQSLGFTLGVASRPANASTLVRRTGLPNGDIVEEILSSTTQKAGGIEPYTSLQNRDTRWESQRRRQNGRGAVPSALVAGSLRQREAF